MNQQQEVNINSQETALKIIIQACNLAQSRGAFNLTEAGLLDKCIKMFTQQQKSGLADTVINDTENVEIENIQI